MRGGAAAAALALALAVATAAGAEIRRFEVVGAIPVDPAKPVAAPRQAALQAALAEAVALAATSLLAESTGRSPAPGEPPPALAGDPTEYAVSYRVLEDRGEQDRLLTGAGKGREYVVLAEVQIDLGRVRSGLESTGRIAAEPATAPAGPFQLEILDVPTPAVWTAVRFALIRAGARSVLPEEVAAGRAVVRVDSAIPADRIVERTLPIELPDGLGIEALPAEGERRRVRIRPKPPPALEPAAGAPSEPLPDAAPAPAPNAPTD